MGLKRFFEPRLKLWDHMVQLILILIAISLTGAHMNLGVIYGRPEIMTIAMGTKSMIVIFYQLLTQHISRFRRWESALANMILNILEVLFWFVIIILKIQGAQKFCEGTACSLSVGVIVVAFFLLFFCIQVAITSVLDYRYYKMNGTTRRSSPDPYAYDQSYK